jgi:tetratricopeptide (TPR) repeat protein
MKQYYLLFRDILSKNLFFPILTGLTLVATAINELLSLIKVSSTFQINISIVVITFFFGLRTFFKQVEIKKEPKFGVNINVFSDKAIRVARLGKYLVYVLLLIPIYFAAVFWVGRINASQECTIKGNKLALFIANFSEEKNYDDGFTSALYGRLNSELQKTDTINLLQLDKYISESSENYLDTIKTAFASNCAKSGLFVFGNRKDNKQFNCRIYSFNFLNFNKQRFTIADNTIIYIQHPEILDFTIENEASIVSDFIFGLLHYRSGNYILSSASITAALNENKNKRNAQFISICHLFIGANYSKLGKIAKAVDEYKAGLLLDSTNEYLHYNVATLYDSIGNRKEAFKHYEIAQQLNAKLKNPLHELDRKYSRRVGFTNSTDSSYSFKSDIKFDSIQQATTDWIEKYYHLYTNDKEGVMNSDGDTIVTCSYDEIQKGQYKSVDYFVVKSGKKYGAIIHKHHKDGYNLHQLKMEYSLSTVFKAVEDCIDGNHVRRDMYFFPHHKPDFDVAGKYDAFF